jgi:hypothetical protein
MNQEWVGENSGFGREGFEPYRRLNPETNDPLHQILGWFD